MHYYRGEVTAIYKNKERIDQETQKKYGGIFKMELSSYEPVKDGEGEKPEHFEIIVPLHWGDTLDKLKDLLHQEVFFPYRKTVMESRTFYYVWDGADRPRPHSTVTLRLGNAVSPE